MTSPLLACALCAYNTYMPVLALFAMLRLTATALVARRSLDAVRVVMVFGALELAWYALAGWSIWNSHPYGAHQTFGTVMRLLHLIWETGLPAALLLKGLSRSVWFRRGPSQITWRRSLGIMPAWILLFAGEIVWTEWRGGGF
jgi:hypothetical protein